MRKHRKSRKSSPAKRQRASMDKWYRDVSKTLRTLTKQVESVKKDPTANYVFNHDKNDWEPPSKR